jgi:hypothetical protein
MEKTAWVVDAREFLKSQKLLGGGSACGKDSS